MSLIDGIRNFLSLPNQQTIQTRSEDDPSSLAELLARIGPTRTSPWRLASGGEAMGVPAVFRALSLISNTMGVLSLEAYRRGRKLTDDETPRLIVRPNPFTTPRVFHRDSAFHLARRGEAWWWTAKRDTDNSPMSLIPIDPRQIMVEQNPRNMLRPIITWQGTVMPNDDMTQITYLPDPANPLRGIGPLQACGAAISVAVEAQEYAANFYAGNPADIWIKSAIPLDEDEATTLKSQWIGENGGLPKVTDPGIEDVKDISVDPARAQLLESRSFQDGQVAIMFGIPGSLLEHSVQGASLTYQNVGQEFDKFVRSCLWPNYMEPIEQAISDLLTRQTVARYNVGGLLRADPKTRAEVYNLLIPLGVMTPEQASIEEGFEPGDVENRPVPFAPPQAVPSSLPIQTRAVENWRCSACNRKLAEVGGAGSVQKCRCGQTNTIEALPAQERSEPFVIPQPEVHVHFDEGSIRIDSPVTVEPTQVTIAEGAIRMESPVTIAEGAMRVEASTLPAPILMRRRREAEEVPA